MNGRTSFAFVAVVLVVGCATTREEAAGLRLRAEERVACQEDCEQGWSRAEEWVKKHSGYAFPSEVLVTPERIEAMSGFMECDFGRPRLFRSVTCGTGAALASEPLGIDSGPMSDSFRSFVETGELVSP